MRVSTFKSEVVVNCRKKVVGPVPAGSELLSQLEELEYLGVLLVSEGKIEQQTAGRASSHIYVVVVSDCCEKDRAESEGKALNLLVDLHSNLDPWSQNFYSDQNYEIRDTAG